MRGTREIEKAFEVVGDFFCDQRGVNAVASDIHGLHADFLRCLVKCFAIGDFCTAVI